MKVGEGGVGGWGGGGGDVLKNTPRGNFSLQSVFLESILYQFQI